MVQRTKEQQKKYDDKLREEIDRLEAECSFKKISGEPTRQKKTEETKSLTPLRASLNLEQCMSMIHDVQYRYDLTDEDRDSILKDVYNILGDSYDLLRK